MRNKARMCGFHQNDVYYSIGNTVQRYSEARGHKINVGLPRKIREQAQSNLRLEQEVS